MYDGTRILSSLKSSSSGKEVLSCYTATAGNDGSADTADYSCSENGEFFLDAGNGYNLDYAYANYKDEDGTTPLAFYDSDTGARLSGYVQVMTQTYPYAPIKYASPSAAETNKGNIEDVSDMCDIKQHTYPGGKCEHCEYDYGYGSGGQCDPCSETCLYWYHYWLIAVVVGILPAVCACAVVVTLKKKRVAQEVRDGLHKETDEADSDPRMEGDAPERSKPAAVSGTTSTAEQSVVPDAQL